MRVLLDTNILIHREANRILNEDIGVLFGWMDRLHYEKCVHPFSLREIEKYKDATVVKTIQAKIKNYSVLKTVAPDSQEISIIREKFDINENDGIDTSLLNEVFSGRVSFLISEDRKLHKKANALGISNLVFSIDGFLEKVSVENPGLSDYKTLSVKKEYFGNLNLTDSFFDSFRRDYAGFDRWFTAKSDEIAYVCISDKSEILAFLYVKVEGGDENYRDIEPVFARKKRLKIGTFKIVSNGFKLGERFLKIVFDNAIRHRVDEVYVTLFNKTEEHERLIGLLQDWGFLYYGTKHTQTGDEFVFVKDLNRIPDKEHPKITYPFIDKSRRYFIVPIYPEYHTELFPDSILNNESPDDYIENEPHRNAIQKVYISRSINRNLNVGDVIVFYRTAPRGTRGVYTSVVTTVGVVESVYDRIRNETDFISLCRKRSVFTDSDLREHWNFSSRSKPFVVNFLYLHSFPSRPNLSRLIEIGVIENVYSAPRGFEEISEEKFDLIMRAARSDGRFIKN